MAPRYPSIPDPTIDPASLRDAVLALKQAFELMAGTRGNASVASAADVTTLNTTVDTNTSDIAALEAVIDALGTTYAALAGNQTTTGGFRITPYNGGTISSGTYTPDAYNHNYQYYTNNGAHTLAVPSNDCAIDILVTNGASAGAITFSGSYTVGSSTGDALTTTNGHKFIISIRRINGVSTYVKKALQ